MRSDTTPSTGPVNSSEGSKRSRDNSSGSTNPWSHGDSSGRGSDRRTTRTTKKEKKSSKQKTLGMAWGANSLSSSRSSFRSSPFSDFGSYMVEKNRKLQEQFHAEASTSSHSDSSSLKAIFHGVSIFVDGFTVPSSQELRGCMLKYGGRFENYFSRHHVTHIICSNLPDSKIKNLRSFSGGLPVVKPKWIVDSVAANKLLSWLPYQLDQLADNQPKLSLFFATKDGLLSNDVLADTVCQLHDIGDSSSKGRTLKDINSSEVGQSTEYGSPLSEEFGKENADVSVITKSINCTGECPGSCRTEPIDMDKEEMGMFREELKDSLSEPSTSAGNHPLDKTRTRSLPTSGVMKHPNKGHSTGEDPNFVENYFKSSRLHFIGTWRHRYRKRFPSSLNQVKCASFDLKAPDDSKKACVIHVDMVIFSSEAPETCLILLEIRFHLVDMDCFFVSVVIRNLPELHDKPVAICHSDNPKGTAEISSANYPARDYGIRAGMFVRDAKARCPHLVIFPYNFEAYTEVADHFYSILHKHCATVQAVSCDEAFLDVTDSEVQDPQLLASIIRREVFETTGCTASAGIAGNMLMARLATKTAKPNGQCYIPLEKVDEYLCKLPINALPGIGHVLEDKLKKRNIWTCGQLCMVSKESLQKDFGAKTGEMLWNYSRGVDNRMVSTIQESKSIGAEVNWGVRFKDAKDSKLFLVNLCKEVHLRLQGCGVHGRKFTLKIKKRRKDAQEPAKYMGCGDCENLSHTITVPVATDDIDVIQRITMQLFGSFHIDVKEIRGVGLQVSRLESVDASKQGLERNLLKSWLASTSANRDEQCDTNSVVKETIDIGPEGQNVAGVSSNLFPHLARNSNQVDDSPSDCKASLDRSVTRPALCHLDIEVIESLPPEVFSELNDAYGGKLVAFVSKGKGKSNSIADGEVRGSSPSKHSQQVVKGARDGAEVYFSGTNHVDRFQQDKQTEKPLLQETDLLCVSKPSYSSGGASVPSLMKTDLMPLSLSQVDCSVLQELPKELRDGILQQLPARRGQDVSLIAHFSGSADICQDNSNTESPDKSSRSVLRETELWIGNPPCWVDRFLVSNCLMLNSLAETYQRSGSPGRLSSVLQRFISEIPSHVDMTSNDWDDAISSLSELLKQYIKLKIEWDIEEVYICFHHIRRLAVKSKLFLQVQNTIFPYIQASVGENYGGELNISLE
ncbi:DNA repair protein REV1 isoform X3 [Rhodamnia argentea]|uniref:DNA repair protein REV1 n=1 Tax=Rhodamnia argentea TaxID=178133 RepID=A0ABM3GX05_9MYRT|nr:DNA repair protein REV1 isoform X3 [Rhodamnia argentea]XP_048128865.1 DNA repair protein REV1 isoform X3 [Rhodamnia argentea]XP_048128866.1 DNA repair protein REV1 isoform X3 [Rhodamnia argentea]